MKSSEPDARTETAFLQRPALTVDRISKRYEIYEKPADRLKQFLYPRIGSALHLGSAPRMYFKEFWALRDISFSVAPGEAVGILGRNGAGKSTLLQIIAGTLSPTEGAVSVRGRVAALLELGSGFSPDFTGAENVRLNAALLGLSPEDVEAAFPHILAFADIGDFIHQPVKIYSSGMVLRLAFAVQTAVKPDVLIVDEALAVGDAKFQKKCFDRLKTMQSNGTTILFVTHDTNAVVQLCSRAMILDGGQFLEDGSPQSVARNYHRLLFDVPTSSVTSEQATPSREEVAVGVEGVAESVGSEQSEREASEDAGHVRELRYGSKEAEIIEVGIRDTAGQSTSLLEIHEAYELYFLVRFNLGIETPVAYGLMISTPRGVEVFGTKGGLHDLSLPSSPAGTVFECRYRCRIPFAPGTYFLSASIAHDDGRELGEFLDYRFDALEFNVIGTTHCFTTSLIDLPGSLSHEQKAG